MLFIYFLSKLFFGFFFLAGRNVYGRITIFHRGGGLRRRLRLVDYLRNIGSFGVLVDIFKCRYNTAYLGLVCYFSGFFSLVVVCCGMFVGSRVYSGYFVDPAMRFNPFVCGSSVPLRFVSLGHIVCLVELIIGGGAQVLRAAGL
jgi:large subunit ribosomal protein L2